jgi:hypothetical protein
MTAMVQVPDLPEGSTFDYYGLRTSTIGEDGDCVVFGHPEPRYVIAALNKLHRDLLGLLNMADDRSATFDDMAEMLDYTWAVLINECGRCDPDAAKCFACEEIKDADWWLRWDVDEAALGAFPVVIWRT